MGQTQQLSNARSWTVDTGVHTPATESVRTMSRQTADQRTNEIDTNVPLLPWRHLLLAIIVGLALAAVIIGLDTGFQLQP